MLPCGDDDRAGFALGEVLFRVAAAEHGDVVGLGAACGEVYHVARELLHTEGFLNAAAAVLEQFF